MEQQPQVLQLSPAGFCGQSTNNCWEFIFCAALQPEQAARCSAQQVRHSLCPALVYTADARAGVSELSAPSCLQPLAGVCSFPNHFLSSALWVAAVPRARGATGLCQQILPCAQRTWKCLDAHLWQEQSGISNSCSSEMSRYVIHVTVFKKKRFISS